ncbi:hypothetical protein LTR64_006091 [Lithohypha guttulata]|uniref:uncharacterized protein n=1 Tax=Lithohypha guttulata TaxID=1690604 RepID=UPI002DE184AF|nr:hypothetical protein LTR51_002111 [Lithohypha guttulata]
MADSRQFSLGEENSGSKIPSSDASAHGFQESAAACHDEATEADVLTPLASEQDPPVRGEHAFHQHSTLSPLIADAAETAMGSLTTTLSTTAPLRTNVSPDQVTSGYFGSQPLRSPSSRRSLRTIPASQQSSSGSLHTLAEREDQESESQASIRRAASTRTRQPASNRRHSKSASISQPVSSPRRHVNSDHPGFPEQSLASLSPTPVSFPTRPHPPLRTRSSHPAQNLLYNDMATANGLFKEKLPLHNIARTADNTPMSSPGLYSPTAVRHTNPYVSEQQRPTTPTLHHLQAPKETNTVEIDHDLYSGNKLINEYEVVRELGRGEHGKVKLGRDLRTQESVAIKIVPRYSKTRRLGRLGEPQDQTKREVAILKKARHVNVVSLLEVIDDPGKKKVYLILEFVERGEIKWRREGVREITKINKYRFSKEVEGKKLTLEPSESELWQVRLAAQRHEGLEKARSNQPHASSVAHYYAAYDIDEEGDTLWRTPSQAPSATYSATNSDHLTPQRQQSLDDHTHATPMLAGSMYGPYMDEVPYYADRKNSVATALSHMSSEIDLDEDDDELNYVPALTFEEAKHAFRDTLLGLEFLHAIGIIHRDIKPANLLVANDGTIKISDFGVSYFGKPLTEQEVTATQYQDKDAKSLDNERELARSVGTPGFWAPELCYEDAGIFHDGKAPKITGAIDLWALGVTLYAMVYARLPFYATGNIGLHQAQCTLDPVVPTTRLVPADTSNDDLVTHSKRPINSNKRLDYELKFEDVPEDLRHLIKKLLTKDPAHRITIAEAKQHSWVLENMHNPGEFLKQPELAENGTKILDVDEREMSGAVSKLTIFAEIAKAGKAVLNVFTKSRKRGQSMSSNAKSSNSSDSVDSPSSSTTSTVGKIERGRDFRRSSLHGDDLVNALQRSREPSGHPLAQSQTASPDDQEMPSYFTSETPKPLPSPRVAPQVDHEGRPKLPDRAISALSTADSIRTIRASQVNPYPSFDGVKDFESPQSFEAASSVRSRTAGLWEGATRSLTRWASQDRHGAGVSRSPSISRSSSTSDTRSVPSLAVSNTQASGSIETPEILRSLDNHSQQASPSSPSTSTHLAPTESHHPRLSSGTAFSQAQEINQRRHIQEARRGVEDALRVMEKSEASSVECPPSPDDLIFKAQQTHSLEEPPQSPLEAGSGPSMSTAVSSVEDFTNSSVTQSISNPSFVATSGASSPPDDSFLSAEYKEHYRRELHGMGSEPDFMRTNDTVIEHHEHKTAATNQRLTERHPMNDNDEEDEDQYEEEEDFSDEEEMVMMGAPKKRTA